MIIVIDSDGKQASLRCVHAQDLKRAYVLVNSADVPAALGRYEGITVMADEPGHVLVDSSVLRTLALAAVTEEWTRSFDQLLAHAADAGSATNGKVRLRVEVGGG